MHFVDQGEGPVVLLQHGNPTWSFLWRKVIRLLAAQKVRLVAPDLVGLGLSDKPREAGFHSLRFHALNLGMLVKALDLTAMTIVGQDWGGPIVGLMAAYMPERVAGAVFANTGLAAPRKKRPLSSFHLSSHLPLVSTLIFRGANFPLPFLHRVQGNPASIGPPQRRAYRWPLRRFRDRIAPPALAHMVPTGPPHRALSAESPGLGHIFPRTGTPGLGRQRPRPGDALHNTRKLFPAAGVTETQAGHFLQEEVPEALAEAIMAVVTACRR